MGESEKVVESYLFKEMRKIGGMSSKWICPNHRGKPDRICEFPNGLVVFVETKSEGDSVPDHQVREHRRMRKRGQIVCVLDTRNKVDQFVKHFRRIDRELGIHRNIKQYSPCEWKEEATYSRGRKRK